jgi:secreted trypsin-like serine protease
VSQQNSGACTPKKSAALNIEDGSETDDFDSVVLIMSDIPGQPQGSRYKCTGTIVGHNVVLTAAHCIRSAANTTYVAQTGSLRSQQEHDEILKTAVKPKSILTHGTVSHTSTSVNIEYMADDLAVLIFADNTFQSSEVTIPSVHSLERPAKFTDAIMIGFGKSSESDQTASKMSIKRVGSGSYVVDDILGKNIAVSFAQQLNPETLTAEGPQKYSRAHQGDSGGPLFVKRSGRLDIVGVASAGGTSSRGAQFTGYADLYTPRSLSLLNRATSSGAVFSKPSNLNVNSSDANKKNKGPTKKCLN